MQRIASIIIGASLGLAVGASAFEGGGSELSGLSPEQLRDIAAQGGGATGSGKASAAATSGRTSSVVGQGTADSLAMEGRVLPLKEGKDSLARGKRGPRPGRWPDSSSELQRYGRKVFESADPSLFGSYAGAVASGYALGPGDEIVLTLWGQKDARYQIALDRDGQVSVEGLGVVSLNGLTVSEASDLLRRRLRRIYAGLGSGRSDMDLTLGKLKQVRVFVVGEATTQGGFLLSGNTSVLAALYQAKGPTESGSERDVEIVRGKQRIRVDLYDYFFRGQRPVGDVLQDGDVVRVLRHGPLVAVRGDVEHPGVFEIKAGEGAKEVLEYAGGARPSAADAPIQALRIFENGRRDAVSLPSPKALASGASSPLSDGDTLQVLAGQDPSSATVVVSGQVRFPGVQPVSGGRTAADFLRLAGGPSRDAYQGRVLLSRRLPDGSREQMRFSLQSASSVEVAAQDSIRVYDVTALSWTDSVRITGAVRNPGTFVFNRGMTVKDLILKAGGFRWGADWGDIRLETPIPGRAESSVEIVSLDSSLSSASADRTLAPRAHVAVPFDPKTDSLELVEVRGRVARPGSFALQRTGERLSSLWERVGGLQPDAYLKGARLIRNGDSTGRIQIDFEKALRSKGSYDDLPLRGGDSIFIPVRPATVLVSGRVNSPANVIWREGKSWNWYVQQAGGLSDSADESKIFVRFADGTVQTRDAGIEDPPNPGSEVVVPFRKPPEPTTAKDFLSGLNLVLGTAIAGLTLLVLLK